MIDENPFFVKATPQVRFWFPARIPAAYELPWYTLSKNVKKK